MFTDYVLTVRPVMTCCYLSYVVGKYKQGLRLSCDGREAPCSASPEDNKGYKQQAKQQHDSNDRQQQRRRRVRAVVAIDVAAVVAVANPEW